MKVSVAAQVLSAQTSAMLKYTSLYSTTVNGENVSKTMKTTGEAVEFMDKLFDSVNGSKRSTTKGKLRGPVKPNSEHFCFWHEAIETLKNLRFIDSASKKALMNKKEYYIRVPSLDGWVTTLESFVRIAKLLFSKYGLKYFYPRFINQDTLEIFIGRIRAINYRNVNPDSCTFINSFKSLLISNVMGPHSIYSNCEEDDSETIVDFFNLLKEDIGTDDKENLPVNFNCMPGLISLPSDQQEQENNTFCATSAINERVRVHSSAYIAGYLCRRISKKFNCKECQKTYIGNKNENINTWIAHREYKKVKNSNLAYPSKRFLIVYRDVSNLIHNNSNNYAHTKSIGKCIKHDILKKSNFYWLGCKVHKT
ncbi:uncharacterized protein LOC106711679 [Papilio machaon]|uniref:uncharacterized protein LOC106711679 n=1 Tax=Papilio machaon TaxID=76193 RepID=UPI001E664F3C|nr:uncharacterized protein LOC106711679 [Papilio machaon]